MQCLIDKRPAGERGCILSDCGTYRYRLWREWDRSRPTLAFLLLNPSTADHLTDDPTIARCLSRAVAGEYGRLEVANLFPLRAIHPAALRSHPDPLGPVRTADDAVMAALEHAPTVICGWGGHPVAAARAADLIRILSAAGCCSRFFHLGLNKDGSPKHPLYLAASTRPKPYSINGGDT